MSLAGASRLNGEDARNSGLRFDPTRLAIADDCIVDYGVKATEVVCLVRNDPCPGDGGEVAGGGSLGT